MLDDLKKTSTHISEKAKDKRKKVGLKDNTRLMSHTARLHIDGKDLLRNGISMQEYVKV